MKHWRLVLLVGGTELRNILRDRTTLLMMALLPVLIYPLLMLSTTFLAAQSREATRRETLRVALCDAPEGFAARLAAPQASTAESPLLAAPGVLAASPRPADREALARDLAARRLDAAALFPGGFAAAVAAGGTVEVTVLFDASNERSLRARSRVAAALDDLRADLVRSALAARSVDPGVLTPFRARSVDVATPERRGGSILGRAIPLLLVLFAALGAFYPAIDVTAMEKEKGTLETLLSTPAPPAALLCGKFLAVLGVTLLSVALNVGSIGLTALHALRVSGSLLPTGVPAIAVPLDPLSFLALAVTAVPLCALVAALMLSVALFARNFKDAQNYMTPLVLLFTLPPLVAVLPGYEMSPAASLIPVVNATLLVKDLLVGRATLWAVAATALSTALAAALALALAASLFGRESVAFRPSDDIGTLFFWKRGQKLSHGRRLQITASAFALMVAGVYYVSPLVAARDLLAGLAVVEFLFVLAPAIVIALGTERDVAGALRLRLPALPQLPAVAAVSLATPYFALLLFLAQNARLPLPHAELEGLARHFGRALAASPGTLFLMAALLAPLCEELFFRGLLMRHLERVVPPSAAILLSALAFAACHLNPYKFLPTLLAGVVFGWLVRETGSLAVGVAAHAVHNALALSLAGPLAGLLGAGHALRLWYAAIPAYMAASYGVWRIRADRRARETGPPAPRFDAPSPDAL